jgi:sugar/nucleoside kinase (ribokinase family)
VPERFLTHRTFTNALADLKARQHYDVVCAGILVADIFADPIPCLPNPGELTTTASLAMSVGGSAANTAVALRILGQQVDVSGKVGFDIQGDFVVSELRRRGIGVSRIRRTAQCPTSGTVILNVSGEDRRYLHSIGANAEFSLPDLDASFLDGAKVLYFGGYLALPQFTSAQLTKLLREAKSRGITTVLDVTIPTGRPYGIGDIESVLHYADFFLPNSEEAARLTGEADAWSQAGRLAELNPECAVVITRGPQGPLAKWRGRFFETPRFRMESIDESGAGDAFAAGLIAALLQSWDLERVLMFAAVLGGSSTRALGCFNSVFTFDEAVSFLESEPETRGRWDTLLGAHCRPA